MTKTKCKNYFKDFGIVKQEAQLPLREQGVSFMLSSHHNTTHGNLAFLNSFIGLRYLWDFWQTYMATDARICTKSIPTQTTRVHAEYDCREVWRL